MAELGVLTLDDVELSGKRVLIRADLNVPVSNGSVTSDARIQASIPTIRRALEAASQVVVMSHLGRPEEGSFDPEASLQPVVDRLANYLMHRLNCWVNSATAHRWQRVNWGCWKMCAS